MRDMEILSYQFPDREDLTVIPISDVHLGAAEHMTAEWNAMLDSIAKDDNARVILCGDLCNNCTRTSISNIFDETMRPREQKKVMVEMLRPIKDKILLSVSGNHERRSGKDADDDMTYDILCKLDIEDKYCENIGFVKIQMGERDGAGQTNPTYTLAVTHGAGGGALSGGVINRNERFGYVIDGIDALIVGHSHKPMLSQPAKLLVDKHNNKVTVKPFKVIVATSFLGYGGYAAQKMLVPSSFSPQLLTLRGKKKEMLVTM